MKIATWNINGIRARAERVSAWIEKVRPDVVCLQEIKTVDATFPYDLFTELGYNVETFGQKAYNGVAIASVHELTDVVRGFDDGVDDPHARFIAATVQGVRVAGAYFPNGKEVGCDKYAYKLAWMERLRRWLEARRVSEAPWVLCGDFNVAPAPVDTHDPDIWEGGIICSDKERAALGAIGAVGLQDALRHVNPDEQVFTWWDYRAAGFRRNRGLRIDHFYVSEKVLGRVRDVWIDREERKQVKPSDHAPVVMELS